MKAIRIGFAIIVIGIAIRIFWAICGGDILSLTHNAVVINRPEVNKIVTNDLGSLNTGSMVIVNGKEGCVFERSQDNMFITFSPCND